MRRHGYVKMGLLALLSTALTACDNQTSRDATATQTTQSTPANHSNSGTCSGVYPSYWQDPKFPDMYAGQTISDQPSDDYDGPVFQLSDDFPTQLVDERPDQPWRDAKFDAMFDPSTDQALKSDLALEYSWLVMRYLQAGNIDSGNTDTDWNVCNNAVRSWYNIPYQTYNVLAGREFTHGLTREAPVSFSMSTTPANGANDTINGTMWAIGFFNPTAAYTLGTIWQKDGTPKIPTDDVWFEEGAVIGKPLFTTLTPTQMPMLNNIPAWSANISSPDFCGCTGTANPSYDPSQATSATNVKNAPCTMAQESQQCPRSLDQYGPVTLLQFDIAVKDSRAPTTQWVFGTFVADGQRKANEANPWNRISPLGLMWGNSTPPAGVLASSHPVDPRQNGFEDMVLFWDTVDMLNADGGNNAYAHPGHLGCNSRLDGPADKAYSSCMSCHGTASVADSTIAVPPIAPQFGGLTSECALQNADGKWIDASGASAKTVTIDGATITYPDIDSLYFASTPAAKPWNAIANTRSGPVNVLPGQPAYKGDRKDWISLDYSLQTSISIVQWMQWMEHANDPKPAHLDVHHAILPRR